MKSSSTVTCVAHGDCHATFVCEHLFKKPQQPWFSDLATPKKKWPDAWCAKCESVWQEHGQWNDTTENQISIKLICNQCYEDKRAESVDSLKGKALSKWSKLVDLSHAELHEKQDNLTTQFELSKHERWDYDQATGEVTFSNKGIPTVVAKFQSIGLISSKGKTWLWAWANQSTHTKVRRRVKTVAEYGFEHGFPRLTVPMFAAEEVDGWEFAGIAVYLMNAKGVYRIPGDTKLFLATTQIKWVN